MARFNSARFSAAQSRLRSAISNMKSAQRRLEYELRHPVVRIACTCGYRSECRRSIDALPEACPSCGGPIFFLP